MNTYWMFLHGMGIAVRADAEDYSERLTAISTHPCYTLFYGDVVEEIDLGTLDQEQVGAADQQLATAETWALAWTMGDLGLDDVEADAVLAGVGAAAESAKTAALNAYKYAYRYLRRRQVFSSVREALLEQVRAFRQETGAANGSIRLVAHSLGTVVALDLLNDAELGPLFSRYISLGSPLGTIARVPLYGKTLLPPQIRQVPVPWIDIAAPDDLVAIHRIKPGQGFIGAGQPPRVASIAGGYPKPHGAYFFDQAAGNEWKAHLA